MKQLMKLNSFLFYLIFLGLPLIICSVPNFIVVDRNKTFVFTLLIPLFYLLTFVFLWLVMAVRVVTDRPLPWCSLRSGLHVYGIVYLGVIMLSVLVFTIVDFEHLIFYVLLSFCKYIFKCCLGLFGGYWLLYYTYVFI